MADLRQAAQQALEALKVAVDHYHTYHGHPGTEFQQAIAALDAALAQKAERVEPVAWANIDSDRLRVDPATGNVSIGAQQAEPVEPVAWMHNILADNIIKHRPADLKRSPQNWTPLCKCADTPPQRKPLTEEKAAALIELDPRMLKEFGTAASGAAMELIRRTERAHGIGGQDER